MRNLLLAVATFLSAGSAFGQVPAQLTYQGRLLKADGTPVTETVTVTLSLYQFATVPAASWSETHTITPSDGYFTVLLGDVDNGGTALPSALMNGRKLWLGVKVGTDPEMAPRTPVASTPYAILAAPTPHAQTHMKGGGDEIASVTPTAWTIPMAGAGAQLDPTWLPAVARNLCVFVAGPAPSAASQAPTLRVPPTAASCAVTGAYASAPATVSNVNWSILNVSAANAAVAGGSWGATASLSSDGTAGVATIAPGSVVAPVVSSGSISNATFCLQVSCR